MGGGGRGGRGGGGRGGWGGHHGGHRWWRDGHNHGGYWGSGVIQPWWWDWWYDPYYYVSLPSQYGDVDEDPCNCFGKYKAALDAGTMKEVASKILENCVASTLSGGPCL